jgi:hypothetical protein
MIGLHQVVPVHGLPVAYSQRPIFYGINQRSPDTAESSSHQLLGEARDQRGLGGGGGGVPPPPPQPKGKVCALDNSDTPLEQSLRFAG